MGSREKGAAGFVEMILDIEHIRIADFDCHFEEVYRRWIEMEAKARIVWLSSLDDPAMNVNSLRLLAGNDPQGMIDLILVR